MENKCITFIRNTVYTAGCEKLKVNVASLTTPSIVTKTVGVDVRGCEQLAQGRRTQPLSGRGSNSPPLDRQLDALPLHHHATLL